MKILFHSRTPSEFDWHKELIDVDRVPSVGDFIALPPSSSTTNATQHEVRLVIHVVGHDVQAEVYCNRLKPREAERLAWTKTLKRKNDSDAPEPMMLTIEQAAQATGTNAKTIRRRIESGKLPATDMGDGTGKKCWRIDPANLVKPTPLPLPVVDTPPSRRGRRRRAYTAEQLRYFPLA